jgi:hypothetical protein
MSHSQNKRLEEKLQRMADKRGADSPHAEELARVHPVEDNTPQKPSKKVTEQKTEKEQ